MNETLIMVAVFGVVAYVSWVLAGQKIEKINKKIDLAHKVIVRNRK